MSLDFGNAIEVAKDLLANSKNPVRDIGDVLTLYRAYQSAMNGKAIGQIARAMDRDKLLVPAVQAMADLAPEIAADLADDAQRARFLIILDTL